MGTLLHRRFVARAVASVALGALCIGLGTSASAALFEDDEARRALLDLRQRVEAQRIANDQQMEALRQDSARMTGQNEQLTRDVAELQRRQRDLVQGVDERLRKVEPSRVTVD